MTQSVRSGTQQPPTTVRLALNLPFDAQDLATYLFDSDTVRQWLGPDAKLSDEATPTARQGGPAEPSVEALLSLPICKVLSLTAQVRVTLRVAPRPHGGSRLRIEHSGLDGDDERRSSVKYWQRWLNRLAVHLRVLQHNRRRERQAVVVVHGIGEQRPGQLLREFVTNVFDRQAGEVHFVKPDQLSTLFEMRMVTVPRSDGERPTTDVYELYWAHLIRDTTLGQVYGWVLRLIFSTIARVPHSLHNLVWALRGGLCMAVLTAAWILGTDMPVLVKSLGTGALAALPLFAKFVLRTLCDKYVVGFAGDAARYLEPRAGNIARRQAIREAGAQLLDALHDKGRYSRIIFYGHSLGSVIAYDILNHAWALHGRRREAVPRTSSRALRALEDLLNPRSAQSGAASPAPAMNVDSVQALQHAAWQEYRRNGFRWRVSDFVTAGSPLAHARWLLNLDATTQFDELVRERSFPTCPPQTEAQRTSVPGVQRQDFTFTHAYPDPANPKATRSVQVPHHGGVFAVTRWTNLYFPHLQMFSGDPIGGPLVARFGHWIKDVPLRRTRGFAHGRYTDRAMEPAAVAQVRAALNLQLHRPLVDFAPVQSA